MLCNRIENNAVFIFLQCQTESKTSVKENMLQTFCFQELQDGTGMDKAHSAVEIIAYKGRPFLVFVDEFVSHFALLQLYSNLVETLSLNRMMAAILTMLMLSDQED